MSREVWERKLIQSVHWLYTDDLEAAISKAEAIFETSFPDIQIIEHIKPFFRIIEEDNTNYYENTFEELYRLPIGSAAFNDATLSVTELFKRSGFEDSHSVSLAKFMLKAPSTNEEIVAYIYLARTSAEQVFRLTDEDLAKEYRALEIELDKARTLRISNYGIERDRFAFFNELSAEAKFDFWKQADIWSEEECIALSKGKEPKVVNRRSLEPFQRRKSSPFREDYEKRWDLLERAVISGRVTTPIIPKQFVAWAKDLKWELPEKLVEMYDLKERPDDTCKDQLDEHANPSRGTIYRVLLGMAISRFEHRTHRNSPATAQIESELNELQAIGRKRGKVGKISVSNDSIRSVLEVAARYLELEWNDKIEWKGIRRKHDENKY